MSIKFVCRCGKRLRAQEGMAARRSVCPRCGAPVGVPSLQPTVRGAPLGPMSPAERLHARQFTRPHTFGPPDPPPTDSATASDKANHPSIPPRTVSRLEALAAQTLHVSDSTADTVLLQHPPRNVTTGLVVQTKRRRWWSREQVERHWYQCLVYPIRAWPLVLGLAVLLTGFSGGIALALPHVLADLRADASWLVQASWLFFSIPLLIAGYACGLLDCALLSGMVGEVGGIRWPGRDISLALKSGTRWLICFLAGPALPAGASLLFWIHGGDLRLFDWLILAETSALALSVWLLLLWAVNDKDRLRDRKLLRMGAVVDRLGQPVVALAIGAAVLALANGWLLSVALVQLHHEAALGWFLLFLSWAGGLFFATFLFRWVGVRLYWSRLRTEQDRMLSSSD
jgi:hypothetical protein